MIIVQAEFTKASRLYLLCQNKISDLYKLQIGKKDLKKDELLKQFDYLLQVMLMYIALIDSHVSPIELNFIDLITVDGDCLKELNKQKGTSYTWDNLCDSFVDKDSFNKFVDETAYLFELKTNQLIMFLASVDAFTDEYEINYFYDKIKEILLIFINFDGNVNHLEEKFADYVLEKLMMEKYRELKSVFEIISKNERLR